MTSRIWRLQERRGENLREHLLALRGLTEPAAIERFLSPDYTRDLHDPFLFRDMEQAVERIWRAITDGERVTVFGDYDADGVLAAAIVALFFDRVGFANYEVYLPDRHNEEHGLSAAAVERFAVASTRLVITVDCGVASVAEVARANELGLEVIITDHHLPPASGLPPALAVIDAARADNTYPFVSLCGAGVAFKLVQALVRAAVRGDFPRIFGNNSQIARKIAPGLTLLAGWEKWLLDLVAIATVADMVPLVGENRALAHFGLKVLRRTPRPGLLQLFRALKIDQRFITEDDIGYLIGPRLNTAGRMSHATEAYDLLTTRDEIRAREIVRRLEEKNRERRRAVDLILTDLTHDGELSTEVSAAPVLVAGRGAWNLGVLGLAAARLAERFERPVFLWGQNGSGLIKGSARSNGVVNLVELMRVADEVCRAERGEGLFKNFGGHALASGFSLTAGRVADLSAYLHSACTRLTSATSANDGELFLDADLDLDQATDEAYSFLEALGPYGNGYPKPLFCLPRLAVESWRCFGDGRAHLELVVRSPRGAAAKAVGFFQAKSLAPVVQLSQPLDLAAHLETSYFRGQAERRLRLVDLRPAV